ncbi:PaaI family thioesterase [Streptomyces sp. NPDC003023]|uniref:PaaI family thioesterase n=1 Tax=Streptomyces sp. NPDC003023 TaxID=3364675 RepID=UPI0036945AE1
MPTESAVLVDDAPMTPAALNEMIARDFQDYAACHVTEATGTHLTMEADGARLRTRPGGSVSGPEQAALVDLAAFLLVNARLGRPTLMALTSSIQISYLSRPRPGPLRTHAEMAKFGSRLCVVLTELRDGAGTLAATATVTYSVPPVARRADPRRGSMPDGSPAGDPPAGGGS